MGSDQNGDVESGLKQFLADRRSQIESAWNRSLPFGDYVSDRWDKAALLGFGEGTSVYDNVVVLGDVSVGKNTWIGPQVVLDGAGGLTVGDFCSISAGVQIYSHDSVRWALSMGQDEIEYSPTKIGSGVYLGPNVVVAKGVTIGDRCVIGANSVVLSDIPSGHVAYGNPCQVSREVES